MARNGSGTYTLPAGQPVVTLTTISSSVFNTCMTDLATALTNSLAANGETPATARIPFANGISVVTDITTSSTTFSIVNATATTVNIGGAATTIAVGAATGTFTLGPALVGSIATDATSATTGAFKTAGGLGVAKALWVGGLANIAGILTTQAAIVNDSTTDSTAITNGAIQTDGGLGVTKALWVGGLANIAGAVTLQSTLALANTFTLTNASTAEIKVVRGSVSLGILQSSTRTQVGTTTNDSWALAVNSADSLVVLSTGITIPGALVVTGIITATAGVYIGAAAAANQIDDASNGAGSTTLYIGNAAITVISDERLKRNMKPLADGLSIIKALAPIEYDQDEGRPFGDVGHYAGFGARHSHKIVPWAINTQGDTGLPWQMRQEFLMAPAVRAIQQLAEKVAALEARQ